MMVSLDLLTLSIKTVIIESLVRRLKKNEEVIGYYFDGYEDKGIEVLTRKKR